MNKIFWLHNSILFFQQAKCSAFLCINPTKTDPTKWISPSIPYLSTTQVDLVNVLLCEKHAKINTVIKFESLAIWDTSKIMDWQYLLKQLVIMIVKSGNLTTTWQPLNNQLAITGRSHNNHLVTTGNHSALTRRPLGDHPMILNARSITWLSSGTATYDHPATTWWPHGDQWRPDGIHLATNGGPLRLHLYATNPN